MGGQAADPYCPTRMETGQLCRRHSGQDSTARGHVSLFNVLAAGDATAEALLAGAVDGAVCSTSTAACGS